MSSSTATKATRIQRSTVEQRFTVDEAADLIRVHPQTVRDEIRAGRLKAKKVGRSFRIKGSDLDAWYDAELEDA